MKIGNYNTLYKYSEDRDLGERLIRSGFKILSDDDMRMFCQRKDSLLKVYEHVIGDGTMDRIHQSIHTLKMYTTP